MQTADRVSRADAERALGSRLSQTLPPGDHVAVQEVPPERLLTSHRLDVAVKVAYVRARLQESGSTFARSLYEAHIGAFNGFFEADGSGKFGARSFVDSFDRLIDEIGAGGYSPHSLVPVAADGVLLDGAHRVAAALALGHPVRTVRLTTPVGPSYGYSFFANRGMKPWALDAAASSYAGLSEQLRVVLLWPVAAGRDDEVIAVLERYGSVVARKEIVLDAAAGAHVVQHAYPHEPWTGALADDFSGIRRKTRLCWGSGDQLRVFLVDASGDMVACKDELRALFGIGKHSVHINDTHAETVDLVRLLFNANSLHHAAHAPLVRPTWFRRLFAHYDEMLDGLDHDERDRYCLDGSAVLAAYGIRDVRDLDYLYSGSHPQDSGYREIAQHVDVRYRQPVPELVADPRNHFWLRGRKVLALDPLLEMKRERAELKDLDDVRAVETRLGATRSESDRWSAMRQQLRPARVKGRVKVLALRGRYHAIRVGRRLDRMRRGS